MKAENKKTAFAGALLMMICGAAAAAVLLKEFKAGSVLESICSSDFRWLMPGFAVMLFYSFAEGLNIRRILSLSGIEPGLVSCLKYALSGFFFSAITPSASGGQPAQLYLMKRDGVPLSSGVFSLLTAVVSFQISSIFLGICGAIYIRNTAAASSSVMLFFVIGFSLNIAVLLLEFCIMFSEGFANFAEHAISALALRCSRVQTRAAETAGKITGSIKEYRRISLVFREHPEIFIKMLTTSLVQLVLYNSIPFFCANALGLESAWLPFTLTQSMLFVSVSSFPLPGASGITEVGFTALFSLFLSGSDLAALMLLSRSVSFIIPLIFSGLAQLVIR